VNSDARRDETPRRDARRPPPAKTRGDAGSATSALVLSLSALGLLALVLVASVVWWNGGLGPLVGRERCVADVAGTHVELSPTQAEHAATIAAVAQRRDLPRRAVTVALATAYQESDLQNLPHGDRDSAGLFQQRPSQGWGSFAQVTDPDYAAQRFYDALVAIPGWQTLAVTRAAQAVQRSAFPSAYQQHAAEARALAAVFSGQAPAALTCTVQPAAVTAQRENRDGLTPRADTLLQTTQRSLGPQSVGGFAPGGVDRPGVSAHDDGRAIDVFFRPHTDRDQRRAGWALAQWAVANADRLQVSLVIFDDHIWSARRSPEGWRDYVSPFGDPRDPVERHLDHVHLEVTEGSASTPA
jgi:hypothetical protein